MLRVGEMVQWLAKDAWWREDCPLHLESWYRITEVASHDEIGDYYKIGGWYVMSKALRYCPIDWVPSVGEQVRIALRVDVDPHWKNTWSKHMTPYIGRIFTVAIKTPAGVYFEEDGMYGWPISCLEPA